MKATIISMTIIFTAWVAPVHAEFQSGPVIADFGKHAPVELAHQLQESTVLKVAFDVSEAAEAGALNRRFDSLARFINMHVANGVDKDNIHLALVVHGKASFDLLNREQYQAKYQKPNPNLALLDELTKNQVKIVICGQSAAYYQIEPKHTHPSVEFALSAMTAHALLAQQGYSLNPF